MVSPGVGSEAISLHDKHGNHPREMLVVPDFFFSRVLQSAGRVNRIGMKSDAKTMIVYSKTASLETRILQSMLKKSQVARSLMAKDQEIIFPADFPFYIEGDEDRNLEQQLNNLRI